MTVTEFDQWTQMIRPLLGGIRSNANWVQHHSQEIIDKVRMLPYSPNFETEAQAELEVALKTVRAAEKKLEEARRTYRDKPVK